MNLDDFIRLMFTAAKELKSRKLGEREKTFMTTTQWQYLESRPHPWRKQLYFKGKRLKAFDVWMDMMVNKETPTEAAENWDLPLDAVMEAIKYCQTHQELLKKEAQKERCYLEERGIPLGTQVTY